jgi:Mce-associated membrane protein
VLAGLAAWFAVQANTVTGTAAARNTALTDTATTSQLLAVVTTDVNALFSYTYADPGRTETAARADLAGQAVSQYRRLHQAVQQDAAKSKQFVLTTAVTNAGVETIDGNSARVLVFSNQVLSSSGQKPQSFDAMVAVNLTRDGSSWKIAGIDTFSGGA